jgi:predicted TIM-barrel fold metal-dependent hydrolase
MAEPASERWDTIDRYVLVSADAHAGADVLDYKPYLASRWHDDFDRWAAAYHNPWPDLGNTTAKRNWDNDYRMQELDEDGIAAEVVFPNTTPPFFELIATMNPLPRTFQEYERRWAGLQAHNRWLLDFCSLEPVRRRGLAQILPHDVDDAVETIEWAASSGGLIAGVLMPTIPPNHPVDPVFYRRYDPIWRACEETGIPFHQHGGTGSPEFDLTEPGAAAVMFMEYPIWPGRTVPHMALGGVFERFPELKVVVTETYSILRVIEDRHLMDSIHASISGASGSPTAVQFGREDMLSLSMKPSEYLDRNVYYGVTGSGHLTPAEVPVRYEIGVEHLMWGNDYPHEEGTAPDSTTALRWVFADVPVEETRKLVAGNAAGLYGFDLDALAPIAERIGPRVSDVHTPLTAAEAAPAHDEYLDDSGARPFDPSARPFEGGAALARR